MPNIPQIKIGTTVYDCKDVFARNVINEQAYLAGVHKDIRPYLYRDKCYMYPDGHGFNPTDTMCVFKISLSPGDIIYMKAKDEGDSPWAAVGMDFRGIVELANQTWINLYNSQSPGSSVYGTAETYEVLAIARPGTSCAYFQMLRDKLDKLDFYFMHNIGGSTQYYTSEKDVIRKITSDNAIPVDSIYMRRNNDATSWTTMLRHQEIPLPLCMYVPVKAGQKVSGNRASAGFGVVGQYNSYDDTVFEQFTPSEYVIPKDGFICVFRNANDPNIVYEHPANSIKVKYSDILDPPEGNLLVLDGKKVVSFGDSITNLNLWQPMVRSTIGGTWALCAIGSTPLSGSGNSNAFWKDVRMNAVKAENPDLITILGGANDLIQNPVIGTDANLVDKDTDTFIGAYSYIIDNLLTWKPSVKIVILSTTWAHNDGKDYSNDLTYGDFAEACKKVAEYYHLPYVDLYNESGYNQYTLGSSPNNIYSSDHIHPNAEGAKIIASMVIAKIREVYGVS